MLVAKAIAEGCRSAPVVVIGASMLIGLLAWRVKALGITQPVVLVLCSIYVVGYITVVVGRECEVSWRTPVCISLYICE